MGAEWITHKGKKIIYISYSNHKKDEMMGIVVEATDMILNSGQEKVLSLTDVRDSFVDKDFLDQAKEYSERSLPKTKKAAIVGVTGIKKVLLRGLNAVSSTKRVPFDTVEEAKDWLVE